jgi:hypothetical protein
MTGMAVLLFVRPIVRHRDRFAQSDERGDGWSGRENIQTERENIEVRALAFARDSQTARQPPSAMMMWPVRPASRRGRTLISEGARPCSGRGRYRPVDECLVHPSSATIQSTRGVTLYHEPVLAMLVQGSAGGSASPACSSSMEMPSRLRIVGLGNLGQAFAWLRASLPYEDPS